MTATLSELTMRELEVLQLMAEDMTNDEIAGQLSIAPFTVKNHVARIIGKLCSRSRAGAVAVGLRQHLIR